MQNRLTIKDIARLSGVGKSTVSRVSTTRAVSERTRERVEAVMQQHGFLACSAPCAARAIVGINIIVTRL